MSVYTTWVTEAMQSLAVQIGQRAGDKAESTLLTEDGQKASK